MSFYKALLVFLKVAPVKLYQPIFGSERENITRDCKDRWEAIEQHLSPNGSLLDIGCNIGYFTFMASKNKINAFGIDSDPLYMMCCNAIKTTQKIDNAFFMHGIVDKEHLKKMPYYDTILCLSVFHHWVKAYGSEEAMDMMRIIATRCNAIFFETGQSNEFDAKWVEKLNFMGDKPLNWSKEFLENIGFKKIVVVGTFATGLTEVDRYLICGKK